MADIVSRKGAKARRKERETDVWNHEGHEGHEERVLMFFEVEKIE